MRSTTADHQQLITERQAATWLGISQRTLWQRRHDGLLPFVRDGRLVRYDLDDLRCYVEANRQPKNEKGGGENG